MELIIIVIAYWKLEREIRGVQPRPNGVMEPGGGGDVGDSPESETFYMYNDSLILSSHGSDNLYHAAHLHVTMPKNTYFILILFRFII